MTLTAKGLQPLTRIDPSLPGEYLDTFYVSLSAAVTAIGATVGTLRISTANFPNGSTTTVPTTLKLEWVGAGSLAIDSGETVTILSDTEGWPTRQLFSGAGTVLWTGNKSVDYWFFQWWGAKGDDSTDCTSAIQLAIDSVVKNSLISGTFLVPNGIYRVAGALQDTSLSNSQIVLPKVNSPDAMLGLRILGASPPPQAWATVSGAIFRSTLATGAGAMIGVRNDRGFPGGSNNNIAHNGASWLSLHLENLTLRLPANPTNSNLDMRFLPNVYLQNVRVDVDGIDAKETDGVGGAEGTGPVPDIRCTEPTTATSFGIKSPIDYNPNLAMFDNVEIAGYYNGIQWGELGSADNITIAACKVGLLAMGTQHPSNIKKLLIVTTAIPIKAGGADALFTAGTNTTILNIQQLDIEDSSPLMTWAATTPHISDANNYLYGEINWFRGEVANQSLIVTGGANLSLRQIAASFHSRSPFTELTGGTVLFQSAATDHAVDETYRGLPSSSNSRLAWKVMTSDQSSTSGLVGILAFVNANIAGNVDKRLAQIAALCEGATNSGSLEFYTMNAGTLSLRAWFDKYGNFNLVGLSPRGEGAALTIASNTIAPTQSVHPVGAGLIKTITVPSGPTACYIVQLIPTAAFTYDATGNIGGAGGTAVIGRTMIATWVPSLAKWALSY